jgi:hypothetical protein
MSTIPLRVAEVEARLHLVRRRINAFTLQHVSFLALSAVALTAAVVIVVGLRASPETFRLAAWGALAVTVATAATCAGILTVRWVDLRHAAVLADRRCGLSDRLTTLMSLRWRRQESQLTPLLVTQVLDMRSRWRPEIVAPRALPRSAFILLASLLLLASTAFLERSSNEAAAAKPESSNDAETAFDRGHQPPRPQPRSRQAGEAPGASIEQQQLQPGGEGTAQDSQGLDVEGKYDGQPLSAATAELSQLPDRLQDAIRRAFRAEPMKEMRSLDGIPDGPASGQAREGRQRDESGPQSDGDSTASAGTREVRGETDRPSAGQPPLDKDQKGDPQQRTGQRRDDSGQKGTRAGSSAGAGSGSATQPSLGDKADLGNLQGEPTTFKVTLSSFLAAVESRGIPQRSGGGSSAPAAGEKAARSLNDRQLKDDVLRKPEIPPEYEDVVRRAYSAGK